MCYQVNWMVGVGWVGRDRSEGNLAWWSVFDEFTCSEQRDIHALPKVSIVHFAVFRLKYFSIAKKGCCCFQL